MRKLLKNKTVIGGLCLLLAAVVAFILLPQLYKEQAATVNVVRLRQDVAYGTVITDAMLTSTETGAYGLPDGVVTDKTEALGMVASRDAFVGEYLWRGSFVSPEEFEALEQKQTKGLGKGRVLLTLAIPRTSAGVAGVLRAGDIVDVYGYTEDKDLGISVSKELGSVQTYDILNDDLRSLNDLDAELEAARAVDPETDPSDYDFVPAYVVMLVTPKQAERLIRLDVGKALHLVLRETGVRK